MEQIEKKTFTAAKWRFATIAIRVVVQLLVTITLARLLPIEAFGLIGQAAVFIGLVTVFSEIGMAPVIIQRDQLTKDLAAYAYSISLMLGILWTLLLFLATPLIAMWFQTPELIPVLRALSLSFLFSGLTLVAMATMERELEFKKLFWVDLIGYSIGYGGVGIAAAVAGAGVWALVAAQLAQSVIQLAIAFVIAGQFPRFKFRFQECRSLLTEGAGFSATRIVLYAARNVDYLLIGRFLGTVPLGLYTRSYQLSTAINGRFTGVFNTVFFPAYSRMQSDTRFLRIAFYKNVAMITFVMFPVFAFAAVMAEEMIEILLGSKWAAAGNPFRFLCLACIPLCAHNLCETLARACGSIKRRMINHTIYLIGVSTIVTLLAEYGLTAVTIGIASWLVVQWLIMSQLTTELLESSWKNHFGAHGRGVLAALLVGSGTAGLKWALITHTQIHSAPALFAVVCLLMVSATLVVVWCLPTAWLPIHLRRLHQNYFRRNQPHAQLELSPRG